MDFFRSEATGAVPGLIWAYRFQADGTAERVPEEETRAALHDRGGWLWLHLSLADSRAREWISSLAELPARARDTLLGEDVHSRIESDDGVVSGVMSDFTRDIDRTGDAMGHLRFAISETLVVSARRHALESVEATRRGLDAGRRVEAAVGLLEEIVGCFLEGADATRQTLTDELDAIEDRIVDDRDDDERAPLSRIRRQAVRFHRQLFGLRILFTRLDRLGATVPTSLVETAHRLVLRIETLVHDIHMIQERARFLQDEVVAKAAARTNRLLTIISVLTALFVPPTFITGLFGMNTKGLLFAENENAFLYAICMCAVSALGVLFVTRRSTPRRR